MALSIRFRGTLDEPERAPAAAEHLARRTEELGWEPLPGGEEGFLAFRLLPGRGTFRIAVRPSGILEGSADTHGAGPEAHRAVCLLLVEIGNRFDAALDVEDDAGYWDRWDDRALRAVWRGEGGVVGHEERTRERRRSMRRTASTLLAVAAMVAAALALVESFVGRLLDGRWWLALALACYLLSGALRPREEVPESR